MADKLNRFSMMAVGALLALSASLHAQVCAPAPDDPNAPMQPRLDRVLDAVSAADPRPEQRRSLLLEALAGSHACYASDLTDAELAAILQRTQVLPPGAINRAGRFEIDTQCWVGEAQISASATSRRANLTYSFPGDGTDWGNTCSGYSQILPNELGAKLIERFGTIDRGREMIRSSLAAYRRYSGLTYTEVVDNDSAMDTTTARFPARGDIRIGAIPLGSPSFQPLAYNAFPATGVSACSGGDMVLNSSAFTQTGSTPSYFSGVAGDYLYFRNCVAHEHGHGLGLVHSVPCNQQKLMEPFIYFTRALLGPDDIRGVQRNYGDRYAGNQYSNTAVDFGNLTTPFVRSVIERDLSINGTFVLVNSQVSPTEDWFKFTLSSAQQITITVSPTGSGCPAGTVCNGNSLDPACCTGRQTTQCNGNSSAVNAREAGNLGFELRDSSVFTVMNTITAAPAGSDETLTRTLAAGTYYVRVVDAGGQPPQNQTLQMYDLTLRVGTSLAPPKPIAGVNKLVTANTPAYFIGNHNSSVSETGATLPVNGYEWDLDGDNEFEVNTNQQPSKTYVSNGVYPVRLRLTDSNGSTATDTIQVTVRGATTSLSGVSPATVARGKTTPVIIRGTNLKGVTAASQFNFTTGTGVSISGTPVSNSMGTEVSGLSFTVTAGASLGARNLTVLNADGLNIGSNAQGTGVVSVANPVPNDECAGATNIGSTLGAVSYTTAGASTSDNQGCPATLNTDVWLTWTAPTSGTLRVAGDRTIGATLAAYAGTTCPVGPALACGNNVAITFPVSAGQSYRIRVGADATLVVGTANISLQLTSASGACCDPSFTCSITTSETCTGTFNGAATCSPNPCAEPTLACCAADGSCTVLTAAGCSSSGGTAQGSGTTCSPNPCPQPTIACCSADGSCTVLTSAACASAGGTAQAMGSTCEPNPCPQPIRACCSSLGACSLQTAEACTSAGSTPQALGSTCSPTNPCPQPPGACCSLGGNCSVVPATTCAGNGGTFKGVGTTCTPTNPCLPANGACCRGAICSMTTSSSCQPTSGVGAVWISGATACNAEGNTATPCCKADFDKASGVNIDDIFIYLNAWFAGAPAANIGANGASAPNIDDIFLFLNAWFAGCP